MAISGDGYVAERLSEEDYVEVDLPGVNQKITRATPDIKGEYFKTFAEVKNYINKEQANEEI